MNLFWNFLMSRVNFITELTLQPTWAKFRQRIRVFLQSNLVMLPTLQGKLVVERQLQQELLRLLLLHLQSKLVVGQQ
jgi:hypothetical protein